MAGLTDEEFDQLVASGKAVQASVVSMVWETPHSNAMGTGFRVGRLTCTNGTTTITLFLTAAHNVSDDQQETYRVRFEGFKDDYNLKFIAKDEGKDVMLFYVVDAPQVGADLTFSNDPIKPNDKVVAVAYSPLEIPRYEKGDITQKGGLDGVINAPSIIPSVITCESFGEGPSSLQKALCTCVTLCGNSGCPIFSLNREVVGFLMESDGTSREIATVQTIQSFLQGYVDEHVKGEKVVNGTIEDLLKRIAEEYKDEGPPSRAKRARRAPTEKS